MPLPVNVTLENCNDRIASVGLVPIDGAVQWTDPPTEVNYSTTYDETGESATYDPANDCILNLGSKGNFACYLGSMASQTTRRIHCPGVPMDSGERVTGSITAGTIAADKFTSAGDGLAKLSGSVPELLFDTTVVSNTRTIVRDFNPFREVQELDGRNSTYGVYVQWRLVFWPHTSRVGWTVTASFTDERLSDRVLAWPAIEIRVPEAWGLHVETSVRAPEEMGYVDGAYRKWRIAPAHTIHDAQSIRFRGTFFVGAAGSSDEGEWLRMPGNRIDVPRILCDPEEFRGKLFFYQGLPARPINFDTFSCRARYNNFRNDLENRGRGPNDYTRRCHDSELNQQANDGGSQPDFAAGPCYATFIRANGNPLRLPELDCAGLRHMARPITQRRRGLDEVDPNDARIVRWGDYTATDFVLESSYILVAVHSGSTDVRGKSLTGANRNRRYFQRMTGLKRSHFSFYHAIESMLLTGCFDAEDIVRQHIELWLYTWIANTSYTHSRAGELRFSRSIEMMAWCWFLTGDSRPATRLTELAAISSWVFPRYTDHVTNNHAWRSFGENWTNDRVNRGGIDRTMTGTTADPWQIALGVGYYRAYQMVQTTFWLTLTRDITRTWVFHFRYGRYLLWSSLRREYYWRGPRWHALFKLIYPGVNNNPGTYGSFPPASWYSEGNQFILWKEFNANTWFPHMLCVAIAVHTSEPATQNRAIAILAQEFLAWRDAQNVSIYDDRGEWFGDDALIPGYRTDLTIDAEPDTVEHTEPGWGFDTGFHEAGSETVSMTEPAFTLALENTVFDVASELLLALEPPSILTIDPAVGDLDIDAAAERLRISATSATLELVLEIDATAETLEVTEPTATIYEELVAPEVTIEIVEPGFVYDDGTATDESARIRSRSGPTQVKSFSGASQVRSRSGPQRVRAER